MPLAYRIAEPFRERAKLPLEHCALHGGEDLLDHLG
jgi:hypothetical protein